MPDSAAKKAWIKANTSQLTAKLNNNTDADIINYLKSVDNVAGTVKAAIREYMTTHKGEK